MIFDIANPPLQPDSDLDPDLSLEVALDIQGGNVSVAPGDWIDVDQSAMWPDPTWGYSFQVCNVYPEAQAVGILVLQDWMSDTYAEEQLSAAWVTNNFRRLPRT